MPLAENVAAQPHHGRLACRAAVEESRAPVRSPSAGQASPRRVPC